MKTQATAGPWHVSDAASCNEVIDGMGRTIAEVEEWNSEGRGNVKLLAAAPELLEALRMALSAHGRTVEQAQDDVPLESWETAARAAIAKAKGE